MLVFCGCLAQEEQQCTDGQVPRLSLYRAKDTSNKLVPTPELPETGMAVV
jgi:hypothetical protein